MLLINASRSSMTNRPNKSSSPCVPCIIRQTLRMDLRELLGLGRHHWPFRGWGLTFYKDTTFDLMEIYDRFLDSRPHARTRWRIGARCTAQQHACSAVG